MTKELSLLQYVYMGTPALAATILDHLCDHFGPPALVVTQEPKAFGRGQKPMASPVQTAAKARGLKVLATANVNTPESFSELAQTKPDVIVVAAFGQILRERVLTLPRLFCLNMHASLLPKYRGAAPVQRAILNGERETGITIQKMAKKLDTGDIMLQKWIEILPGETSGQLMDRLSHLGAAGLTEALEQAARGSFVFVPQDHAAATYAEKLDKSESPIDWNLGAPVLLRKIAGLQPWPVAETKLDQRRLKIFRAELAPGTSSASPGAIATDHRSYLNVQCGDGQALSLTEIQLENRKKLSVSDFLLAFRGSFPYKKMAS